MDHFYQLPPCQQPNGYLDSPRAKNRSCRGRCSCSAVSRAFKVTPQFQINEISATISRVQDRIRAITHNAEEQAGTWNATMSDLEQKQREVTDKMKGLEHQNAQLQRRSSLRNPEMEEVIHARDEALRKLRLARKVIRDLVDDNEKVILL